MSARAAMVLGGTGLVGRELVALLLREPEFARVIAIGRRVVKAPGGSEAGLHTPLDSRVVDFERLDEHADAFDGVSHIFCALGSTIRQAGSQERFRRIDHGYALDAARLGLQRGAVHLLLVSALGANPASRVFYNRVKGETERDIEALGYPALTIVRPSLLLGDRDESRLGEQVAKRLAWLTPRRWTPVRAHDVAASLVAASLTHNSGTRIIESAEIARHG